MKSTYILLLAAAFATACDNNINGSNEVKATLPVAPPPILPLADTSKKGNVSPQTITIPPTTATKPTATLNPAHGQPGHRCDIAVGAPLSAAPSPSPVNVNSNAPVSMQPAASQPVQNSAAAQPPPLQLGSSGAKPGVKLNPAHGQPGHDCNIEVGKPLKQ